MKTESYESHSLDKADTTSGNIVPLFMHLPKCGGMTFNKIAYRACRNNQSETISDSNYFAGVYWFPGAGFFKTKRLIVPKEAKVALSRPDLRAVVGHFWYGIHNYVRKPSTYCTILRHPVDRILSLHHHTRSDTGMTLEQFLANPPFREVDNDQTRRISGMEPGLGQCTRAMLEQAQRNLQRDFAIVGLTARFEETVLLLSRRFGWTSELSNQRYNVSRNSMKREAIDENVRQTIIRWNELDMELFLYASRLFDEMISRQDDSFHADVRTLRAKNQTESPCSYID